MQELEFRVPAKDLQQVAGQAEHAQQHGPRDGQADLAEHPPDQADAQDPGPEFQGVGDGSERAEVLAPEPVGEKAAEDHQRDRDKRHPEGDLALEAGGDGIIRIQVLAEQFTGRRGHVEDPEDEQIFDDAQQLVPEGAAADLHRFDPEAAAQHAQQVLDRADRAEVGAEQLAQQDHANSEGDAHEDLERTHAAREGTADAVGGEGFQAAERTEGFRIGRLHFREKQADKAAEEEDDGSERSPLEGIPRPIFLEVGIAGHIALFSQYKRSGAQDRNNKWNGNNKNKTIYTYVTGKTKEADCFQPAS